MGDRGSSSSSAASPAPGRAPHPRRRRRDRGDRRTQRCHPRSRTGPVRARTVARSQGRHAEPRPVHSGEAEEVAVELRLVVVAASVGNRAEAGGCDGRQGRALAGANDARQGLRGRPSFRPGERSPSAGRGGPELAGDLRASGAGDHNPPSRRSAVWRASASKSVSAWSTGTSARMAIAAMRQSMSVRMVSPARRHRRKSTAASS